ncbi:MAG: hypothetical protein NC337_11435 [Roseburia sp.]|nr:hypothetical protein [Roseburia sp.]
MKRKQYTTAFLSAGLFLLLTACGQSNTDPFTRSAVCQAQAAEPLAWRNKENSGEIQRLRAQKDREAEEAAKRMRQNEEYFYELTTEQGLEPEEASDYFRTLCADDIFQEGALELTDIVIGDIDANGRKDMLAMVCMPNFFYGESGNLRLYVNGEKAWQLPADGFPCHFRLDAVWEDIDNDGQTELAIQTYGTGCGGSGDWYQMLLKYKDGVIASMELPSEYPSEEGYEWGIGVVVYQEPQKHTFSAYCPYLDETIVFASDNVYGENPPRERSVVGGNCRGYYDMRCIEHEGENAVEVSEYLYGGGIADGIGIAKFLIAWDADGTARVVRWWLEA